MELNTAHLILRNFTLSDIDDVFEYCKQEGVVEKAGWASLQYKKEAENLLFNWTKLDYQLAIVLKENQKVIGHIGINNDSEEGLEDVKELGCALNRYYQRHGFMSEAMQAVIKYLFENNIHTIWACCFQENIASKHLIEKCGFIFQQTGTYSSSSLNKEFKTYEYSLTKAQYSLESER